MVLNLSIEGSPGESPSRPTSQVPVRERFTGSRAQHGGLFDTVARGETFRTRYGDVVRDERAVLEIKDLNLF